MGPVNRSKISCNPRTCLQVNDMSTRIRAGDEYAPALSDGGPDHMSSRLPDGRSRVPFHGLEWTLRSMMDSPFRTSSCRRPVENQLKISPAENPARSCGWLRAIALQVSPAVLQNPGDRYRQGTLAMCFSRQLTRADPDPFPVTISAGCVPGSPGIRSILCPGYFFVPKVSACAKRAAPQPCHSGT